MLLVLAASLTLLVTVGLGEAHRVNPRLQLEKLAVQGEVIRDPIDTFLQAGQPLEQFIGFETRARGLIASDPHIVAIELVGAAGGTIAEVQGAEAPPQNYAPAPIRLTNTSLEVLQSDARLQVRLPLSNRFQRVGELRLSIARADVNERVDRAFVPAMVAAAVCLALFAALQLVAGGRRLLTEAGFFGAFLIVAAAVMAVMFQLFADGVQDRTKALAGALAERLSGAVRLRLELADFTGIDRAFAEYRRLNQDIRTIALIRAGEALIHTDPGQVGISYSADDDAYEFTQALSGADDAPTLRVAVSVPVSVVLSEIWRAGKNFLVLMVATAIVAFLFLDVGSVLQRRQSQVQAQAPPPAADVGDRLTLIRPAYFLVVFLDMLCISFLPQYAAAEAAAAGLPAGWASWPFTVYFIAFAAVLIPAGRYAEGGDLKRLIAGGAACALAGMLVLAAGPGFWSVLVGRGVSGLGQGLLLIGIQSYLLSVVPPERRTQGQAVQVIGYNGALISGSAIGALLAVFIGQREVFVVAAAIGALALVYLWRLVPATRLAPSAEPAAAETGAFAGLLRTLADWRFTRLLLLIGIFSKLVLSGVIMFAIPLVLAGGAFAQEDIGQLLMLYAAATLVSTFFAARLVDRLGSARWVLATGSISAGFGMILVGLVTAGFDPIVAPGPVGAAIGWLAPLASLVDAWLVTSGVPFLPIVVMVLGMVLIGVSHGLIAAPVVTLVGDTAAAARLGRARVTASYRFLERIGHVAGPLLVGHMLLASGDSPLTIGLFGLASIVCALLFLPGRTAARH